MKELIVKVSPLGQWQFLGQKEDNRCWRGSTPICTITKIIAQKLCQRRTFGNIFDEPYIFKIIALEQVKQK